MSKSFSDKFKGAVNKVKGEVKGKLDTAMDNDKVDKFKGQAQDKFGELRDKFTNKK